MPAIVPADERPAAIRLDLRRVAVDDVVDWVEKSLHIQLEHKGSVVKRRSMGFRTDRASWVRIECRGLERLDGQGWGLEAAVVLAGVPIPEWHAGISGSTRLAGSCGEPMSPS